MDTGVLAQMSLSALNSQNGLTAPVPGLSSRRGGQSIKPLSFEGIKLPADHDNQQIRTPRTSRSHLLQALRTAPKTAAATIYPASPTFRNYPPPAPTQTGPSGAGVHDVYGSRPKTAHPAFAAASYTPTPTSGLYTVDQVLAPPDMQLDDGSRENMDPGVYAQMVATNMYLAQQQQQLQQQLLRVQAAAQQFRGLSLTPTVGQYQQSAMMNYQQSQQHLLQQQYVQQQLLQQQLIQPQSQQQQLQQQLIQHQLQQQQIRQQLQQQLRQQQLLQQLTNAQHPQQHMVATSPHVSTYFDPVMGQQSYFVEQVSQSYQQNPTGRVAQARGSTLASVKTPFVQVSPPSESRRPHDQQQPNSVTGSPKRTASPVDTIPLPPPSANAFRRGHKKVNSLAGLDSPLTLTLADVPKSAGPKSATFPTSPFHGGYGPGQGRAGEHPIRQPRGPPSLDELLSKPTTKHDGSKNFATRTRRSAVHNLVRAGMVRRQGTSSSSASVSCSGSTSPVSECYGDITPVTDGDSTHGGSSGSGSLSRETEYSHADIKLVVNSAWGAIGSDRPSSRQKTRHGVESGCSDGDSVSSFADMFKNAALISANCDESAQRRKAPMLVLTSADKRKASGFM